MAAAYYFDHGPDITTKFKEDGSLGLASIVFHFKIAGRDVTDHTIREQYQELLERLKASKAFRGLVNSDNMSIGIVKKDGSDQFVVQLTLKNDVEFSYNHVANPRKTALDTIERVFSTRFNPSHRL